MRIFFVLFFGWMMVSDSLAQDYRQMRETMVERQIKARGINHKATLDAMLKVERHLFVPSSQQRAAYDDSPMPIGYGQTISQPYIVAYMTEIVAPKPGDKILEIGTGSGYQAAVLSMIVDSVFTVEIIPELGAQARERLKKLNFKNVEVITGDGYNGLPEHAPFDAIVVTAAAEHIPPPLISQLKDGGNMIIPVGSPFMVQTLMLVTKKGGKITTKSLMPVRFVPFTRKATE
jgi:protein-L-isoaspartate(D-aspartate) O-methyltransferase